jgi:sugar phosphate isomerase/epimerase
MALLDDGRPLVMCTATLLPDPLRGCTREAFVETIDAAAATGCSGVSLWAHAALAGDLKYSAAELISVHTDRGVAIEVVEIAMAWANGNREVILGEAEPLLDLAAAVGAKVLMAVTLLPVLPANAHVGLAILCDAAAERGVDVAVEFLPWSGIADLATAWRLVQACGRENVGLVIDSWHWMRQPGGPDLAALRDIPPERILVLQLNDAPQTGAVDLLEETMTRRLPPGEGDIDLRGLLRVLAELGADPLVAAEVFNTQLAAGGAISMAEHVVAATRSVLAAARQASAVQLRQGSSIDG